VLGVKVLIVAFIVALLFSVLAGTLIFGKVQAATEVSGIISIDTTWTKANSPYDLAGPILVGNEVTLTIEAGATVNLNSYYIRVAGTLSAQGSSVDKINFKGYSEIPNYSIEFTESSTSYNERTGSGCIIENAVINSTHGGILIENVTPKINNNSISAFYAIDVFNASPVISNNIIKGAVGVHNASPIISGNEIAGTIEIGETFGGMTVISHNRLIGGGLDENLIGIFCGNAYINENVIYGFTVAGIVSNHNATIENNLIMYNPTGIRVDSTWFWLMAKPTIRYNTIIENSVGIEMNTAENIDAASNWWGTADTTEVNHSIYDFEDDFNLGRVDFVPFLTESHSNTPLATSIPTPTPKPTATPVPTEPPAATPTAVNGVEIAILIVLIVIAALLAVNIWIMFMNKR